MFETLNIFQTFKTSLYKPILNKKSPTSNNPINIKPYKPFLNFIPQEQQLFISNKREQALSRLKNMFGKRSFFLH